MPNDIEMSIVCEDSDEPIIIRNRAILVKSSLLYREANAQSKNWSTKPTKFANSISVPYSKEVCEFVFKYATKYESSRLGTQEDKFVKYKAAMKKDLAQVHEIMSCAVFLECHTIMDAMGWVSARKLCNADFETIRSFLGDGGSRMAIEIDEKIEKEKKFTEYKAMAKRGNHTQNIQEAPTNNSTSETGLGEKQVILYKSFHELISEFEALFL